MANLAVLVSIMLLAVCLVFNKSFLELVLGFDLLLTLSLKIALVVGFQSLGIVPALWILLKKPRVLFPVAVSRLMAAGLAGCVLLSLYGTVRVLGVIDPYREYRRQWKQVVDSEELILSLDPHMKRLSFSVLNLELPDFQSQQVFADHVQWNDLSEESRAAAPLHRHASVAVGSRDWPVSAERRSAPLADVRIWSQLFKPVDYFEYAKFAVVRGRFLNDERDEYETDLQFSGVARMKAGDWSALSASLKAQWRHLTPLAAQDSWRIFNWTLESLETINADRVLFADALDEALPDAEELRSARRSIREQLVIESFATGRGPGKYFEREAWDRHPDVSVVDLTRPVSKAHTETSPFSSTTPRRTNQRTWGAIRYSILHGR